MAKRGHRPPSAPHTATGGLVQPAHQAEVECQPERGVTVARDLIFEDRRNSNSTQRSSEDYSNDGIKNENENKKIQRIF